LLVTRCHKKANVSKAPGSVYEPVNEVGMPALTDWLAKACAVGATSLTVTVEVAVAEPPSSCAPVTLIVKFETGLPGTLFKYWCGMLNGPAIRFVNVCDVPSPQLTTNEKVSRTPGSANVPVRFTVPPSLMAPNEPPTPGSVGAPLFTVTTA